MRGRELLQVLRLRVGTVLWSGTWDRRTEGPLPLFLRKDVISWELSFVEV